MKLLVQSPGELRYATFIQKYNIFKKKIRKIGEKIEKMYIAQLPLSCCKGIDTMTDES